jgi:Zn finger protein HypA/HybF involved in hydrogenase expression
MTSIECSESLSVLSVQMTRLLCNNRMRREIKKANLQCAECGKKFSRRTFGDVHCPRCKSYDVEVI